MLVARAVAVVGCLDFFSGGFRVACAVRTTWRFGALLLGRAKKMPMASDALPCSWRSMLGRDPCEASP